MASATVQEKITTTSLRELLEKQEYKCAITGEPLTPDTARLDHIIPVSRGGENVMSNVWIVSEQANRAKGTMTMEEFVLLCGRVVERFAK